MKPVIDLEKCQGHARCLALAPSAFGVDDEGYGFVRSDAGADQTAAVRDAVLNCPEGAISFVGDEAT